MYVVGWLTHTSSFNVKITWEVCKQTDKQTRYECVSLKRMGSGQHSRHWGARSLTNGVLQQPPQHLLRLGGPLEEHLGHGREQLQLDEGGGLLYHVLHQLLQDVWSVREGLQGERKGEGEGEREGGREGEGDMEIWREGDTDMERWGRDRGREGEGGREGERGREGDMDKERRGQRERGRGGERTFSSCL